MLLILSQGGNTLNNLQGAVASAFPVSLKGEKFFLVEAILHEGMSGSPVFTRPGGTSVTDLGQIVDRLNELGQNYRGNKTEVDVLSRQLEIVRRAVVADARPKTRTNH